MKIIVCIKQVPLRDAQLRVDTSGRWIDESDLGFEINEPDAYALEEALQLREKHGGEVVVVCAGPPRAAQTIREALAKGADRAIHIETEATSVDHLGSCDTLELARLLAASVGPEKADLIFTGLQSDDLGYGQTGVVLAEVLGLPHATIVMQVEITGDGIRVRRELEDGFFQNVEIPLPALLTIQSGINKLRYATLIGIKQAKNKPMKKLSFDEMKPALGDNLQKIEKLYIPQKTKKTEVMEGPPAEIAKKLVEKLRNELRVI